MTGTLRFVTGLAAALASGVASADDWTNLGGTPGRDCRSGEAGPGSPAVLWSTGPSSIIAWNPVTAGNRLFIVRQTGFPPEPNSDKSPVYGIDLTTGKTIWSVKVPFHQGEWTTWVAGVSGDQVYAARSGNGASSKGKLYALDQATGAERWQSVDLIDAGAYDGVVFAPDGDPVIASFRDIWRINAEDGKTVWRADRVGSVSGNCGGAIHGDAVYVADAAAGGHVIKRYSLGTGAFEYQSPLMAGFTIQNTPLVAPDGTIYLARVQNNPAVDYFYALADSGSAITIKWSVPCRYSYSSEFGIGNDGSVYMMGAGGAIDRLDPANGGVIDSSGPIDADFLAPHFAIDSAGRVFFSNGAFNNGRLWSFEADLTERWAVDVKNVNIGGPALGQSGTLVVAGVGSDLRAYRSATCYPDCDGSLTLDIDDFICFQTAFASNDPYADCDGSGGLDIDDFICFQTAFGVGCP